MKVQINDNLEEKFTHIAKKFQNLIRSEYLNFETVALMKNVMGVYAIYNNENSLIYVGSTNKFHIRFGTDLKYESTHTLMRKLLRSGDYLDRQEATDFLTRQCRYKIETCYSKREAEALESMVIFILNPLYNK